MTLPTWRIQQIAVGLASPDRSNDLQVKAANLVNYACSLDAIAEAREEIASYDDPSDPQSPAVRAAALELLAELQDCEDHPADPGDVRPGIVPLLHKERLGREPLTRSEVLKVAGATQAELEEFDPDFGRGPGAVA